MYTPKRLYMGQPGTGNGTLVAADAVKQRLVKSILLVNVTASDATVTLNLVPNAGAVNINNQIVPGSTVKAKDVTLIEFGGHGVLLDVNETIQGLQGTASAITVHIHGVEV